MIHQVVTRVSIDSFKEKSAGKKVVLLYPWTNYRNLFLTHFLESAKDGLLYYRIHSDVKKLEEWLTDLITEFDDVLGGFGKKTRSALDKKAKPDELGKALATDLNKYSKDRSVLFLDELDRVPQDKKFDKFIVALVDNLDKHGQLVLSSRLFTQQPWTTMLNAGTAVVLGTERRKDDVMFAIQDEGKPQLEIYALGRGHAVSNGQEITNWDGALPRNLFFYFIDNKMVTRDMIFDTFWSNLSVKEATNVFHVTKRKISERISLKFKTNSKKNIELTQYTSGFYMPGDKIIRHYDVEDFQKAVEHGQASENEVESERLFRQAIDLYKAPFLETMKLAWVKERRSQLQMLYSYALISLARIHLARGEKEEALGLFIRGLKEAPDREDIHREVIQLYIDFDMPADARKQYKRMETILKKRLKMKPSQKTLELYETIPD